jgi:hypothetical protein
MSNVPPSDLRLRPDDPDIVRAPFVVALQAPTPSMEKVPAGVKSKSVPSNVIVDRAVKVPSPSEVINLLAPSLPTVTEAAAAAIVTAPFDADVIVTFAPASKADLPSESLVKDPLNPNVATIDPVAMVPHGVMLP